MMPLVAGVGALAVLYLFSPEQHSFYPKCIFFTLTGMTCPGCGALRATHHLLHGELAAAFHFNPLIVISFPFLLCAFVAFALQIAGGREFSPERFLKPGWIWIGFAAGIVFAIGRNLPFAPFAAFRL
jgi:hypothetical protein